MAGSILEISKSIFALVLYTGNGTKLIMSKQKMPFKRSRFTSFFYKVLIFYIFLMIAIASTSAWYQFKFIDDSKLYIYLNYNEGTTSTYLVTIFHDILNYKDLIPIVAIVMLSLQKVLYIFILIGDHELTDFSVNQMTSINNSDVTEDLAEIDHIFSDKTGTLTKNKLTFKEISIINNSR
jgi:phospholipid-translocating ATPase